jgi:hypothetical protein
MEALVHAAERRNVPREQVDQMIRAALRNQLHVPEPANSAEARSWLTEMTAAALADGVFTKSEYNLIHATGLRAGLSDYDVRMLIKDTRNNMYQAARSALRGQARS